MQFLSELSIKFRKFMLGRNGFDKLGTDVLIFWLIINIINVFIRSGIISWIALLLPIYALFRILSKNTFKRESENLKYTRFRRKDVEFFKIQYHRIKEIKTHRYYKCKNCDSYLRVKRKKGNHTVCCPKCGKEFKVKIL